MFSRDCSRELKWRKSGAQPLIQKECLQTSWTCHDIDPTILQQYVSCSMDKLTMTYLSRVMSVNILYHGSAQDNGCKQNEHLAETPQKSMCKRFVVCSSAQRVACKCATTTAAKVGVCVCGCATLPASHSSVYEYVSIRFLLPRVVYHTLASLIWLNHYHKFMTCLSL